MDDGFEVYGEEDLRLPDRVREGLTALKELSREEIKIVNIMLESDKESESGGEDRTFHGVDWMQRKGLSQDKAIVGSYILGVKNELGAIRRIIRETDVLEEIDTLMAEISESVEFLHLVEESESE